MIYNMVQPKKVFCVNRYKVDGLQNHESTYELRNLSPYCYHKFSWSNCLIWLWDNVMKRCEFGKLGGSEFIFLI